MLFNYWPYDELKLSIDEGQSLVSLATPWLTISKKITGEALKALKVLSDKITHQNLAAEDRPLIDWLFQQVDHFPLAYVLPTTEKSKIEFPNFTSAPNLGETDLHQLLIEVSKETQSSTKHKDSHIHSLTENSWTWDHQAALQFATQGPAIHPESLLTVARRFHLLDVQEVSARSGSWKRLQELELNDLRKVCPIIVRQNHLVTEQCQSALIPAVRIAGPSEENVEDFINSEKGHDLILGRAISEMGVDPKDVPVSLNTELLIATLRYAAKTNFLAFVLLVDMFERSNYSENDPMADLLIRAGFEKSAKYINRHMDINDMGEHENVSFSFLEALPLCPSDYAGSALRIAEVGSRLMSTVAESTVNLAFKAHKLK